MEVIKRYKNYKKRTLVITDGKNPVAYIRPCSGWFSIESTKHLQGSINDINIHNMIRGYVMENLYWLLGRDCDEEEWSSRIYYWDIGRRVYGVRVDKLNSMFFEGEKEIALNSFYN